jgi:hypothetical protein
LVKPSNLSGQRRHVVLRQGAVASHRVEQGLLLEPPHLDNCIDQGTCAVELQMSVRRARDGAHAKVQVRGGPAIEFKFPPATSEPLLGRREVEVGIPNSSLQLERAIVDQEDQGSMGRDKLDCGSFRPRKILEKGNRVALVSDKHGRRPPQMRTSVRTPGGGSLRSPAGGS